MKKILLLHLFISFSCLAIAQKRYVDLKMELDSPRNQQKVLPGSSIAINTVLTNLGPDTLFTTDSIALVIFDVNGNVVTYVDNNKPVMYYHGFPSHKLEPGDTMHLNGPRLPILYTATGYRFYCVRATPYTDSINSVWNPPHKQTLSDTGYNTLNNDHCITISIIDVSVDDITARPFDVTVYPNPASAQASFNINSLKQANVSITLTDMTGRIVLSTTKENLPAGKQVVNINTAHLNAGIYLYKVAIGTDVITGKLLLE